MRIAYITYEYPPDIGLGGIATYNFQIARVMKERGHDVEVFCGSFFRNISEEYYQVLTHRVKISDVIDFRNKVIEVFAERHSFKPFDLFESPEINGNGYLINQKFPELPMVVKIHMPSVLQIQLLNYYTPFLTKLKFVISSLIKKRKIDLGFWSSKDKNQHSDVDYLITEQASIITAPSEAMKNWAVRFWGINEARIKVIPYPYIPDKKYLEITLEKNFKRITFIGKLNVHKGLVVYTEAIENVLKLYPDYKFRFVAEDGSSHKPGISMKEYILKRLQNYSENLEFTGSVPLSEIPEHLKVSDICVFPSIWECFGLVVCEAMAAGKPVIVSGNGGMKEIVENEVTGLVVNPLDSQAIAYAIGLMITDKEMANRLAMNGRQSIIKKYNVENIGIMNEKIYNEVICV